MKIGILITAYKDFNHLARLINNLSCPDFRFYIHIDKKSNYEISKIQAKINNSERCIFVEDRININWGGFNLIYAVLNLIREAIIDHSEYLLLISGQDFPLKNNSEILSFFKNNQGNEYLEFFEMPDSTKWALEGGMDRYKYYWLVDDIGLQSSIKFVERQRLDRISRQFPANLKPFGGSLWFSLSFECAFYVYDYLLKNPELVNFFYHTLLPDEMLIPTIVLNSHFKNKVINNNLRYIDWKTGPETPRTLTINDLNTLISSASHFARKFDSSRDNLVIEELEKHLRSR
ncbi:beta-1,6-N-acetylglucosaminyltransferase [Pedobacter borealis]|uniref:beta-1,6-N-acetylglucosaminyltransferase n=1 Tax=Pedobacter borealis TaxID=475254 RepID=UPI0004931F69|nr:beta-1,6-N-acetylglucosaminyltransferase [Pedobacter borealis]